MGVSKLPAKRASENIFAYVGGNPITYVDPSGELRLGPIIAGAAAIYNAVSGIVDSYYDGKKFACYQKTIDQWRSWVEQANSTPLDKLRPSDWYVLQNYKQAIYEAQLKQIEVVVGAYGDSYSGVKKPADVASNIATKGFWMTIGASAGCGCN